MDWPEGMLQVQPFPFSGRGIVMVNISNVSTNERHWQSM
jgi:hypothetical protein